MSDLLNIDDGPYSKDGPFRDPIVRCDSCKRIIKTAVLKERGSCTCESTRVRNVQSLTPEEMKKCREWALDPVYLALFTPIDEDTGEPIEEPFDPGSCLGDFS